LGPPISHVEEQLFEGTYILLFDDVVAKNAFGKQEIIAIELKDRDPKCTCEIVGIYRTKNEGIWVIEWLAPRTDFLGSAMKRSVIGGDLNSPSRLEEDR